jgi:hypothetical protein
MYSGMFSQKTLEIAGGYIYINSKDTAIKNQVKKFLDPRTIALQNAQHELELNAKSTTIGKNNGDFVLKYNSIAGLGVGQPWAGTFISWCYNKDVRYFKPSANINELENYFATRHSTFKLHDFLPQPGDLYFYTWKNARAVGIVDYYSVADSTLHGIEGDSNEDDNGPAYKVAKVTFKKDEFNSEHFVFATVKNNPENQ